MTKILSTLVLAAFAFSAHAASHTGGAPMKADASAEAASAPMAHKAKKSHKARKPAAAASAAKM